MKKVSVAFVTIAALAGASPLAAHHSISMFDISKAIWVEGTVVSYEPISPHAMIVLDVEGDSGQIQRWTIEGPFPGRLARILSLDRIDPGNDFLEAGDAIEVCGFYPKAEGAASRPFVHGQVIVMPDGRMQSWGPYGKIDNCVRPDDRPQSWADFLNSDPLARDFWCSARGYVGVASIASDEFVDDVGELMDDPCE